MAVWLLKNEPDPHIIGGVDLGSWPFSRVLTEPDQTARFNGVRNLQARNFMRDKIRQGDTVLFYHSSTAIPGIAGLATVARAAYPDPDAADKAQPLYDAAHSEASPKWYAIDLRAVRPMAPYVSLTALREAAAREPAGAIASMTLLKQPRLSVQPVTREQLEAVYALEAKLQAATAGAGSSGSSVSSSSSGAAAHGGAGSAKATDAALGKKSSKSKAAADEAVASAKASKTAAVKAGRRSAKAAGAAGGDCAGAGAAGSEVTELTLAAAAKRPRATASSTLKSSAGAAAASPSAAKSPAAETRPAAASAAAVPPAVRVGSKRKRAP